MKNHSINDQFILFDEEEHSNGSSSKKNGKELLATLAPGFLDPLSPLRKTPQTLHGTDCTDKWVSDMSTSSQIAPYLEFPHLLMKRLFELLKHSEQEVIVKDERLKSARKLEVELKQKKLSESTDEIEMLRLEKSKFEIEREKYKVICDKSNKKIVDLEEKNKEESKEQNEKCARLLRELREVSDKVTRLDLEKRRVVDELEKYELKCDELSEEVVELTVYKVVGDGSAQKLPKHQLKRNQECAKGEVNKKRKILNESPIMRYAQAIKSPMEADLSDDDSSESGSNKEIESLEATCV